MSERVDEVMPFGGFGIARDHLRRREPKWLMGAIGDSTARCLLLDDTARVLVAGDGTLSWVAPPSDADPSDFVYLGLVGASPAFTLGVEASVLDAALGGTAVAVREVVGEIEGDQASALLEAAGVLGWHRRHRFCANCGARTTPIDGGHVRRCDVCDTSHFPRTDPAVIMLVSNGDHCVLGRRRGAPEGRWSTLAGFVEPGESLEAAVAREVEEEVGLVVSDVVYRGSQPWPFPASLMVAFEAHADRAPLICDDEHAAVRWCRRDELRAGIDDGSIAVPSTISAGGFLIRSWLARG